jgi:hypothetical protein
MVPTILDRLASVHRTLADVIIPAIATDQPLAVEQAHLSLLQLQILMGQVEICALVESEETQSVNALERKLSGASPDDRSRTDATPADNQHLGALADRRIATLTGIDQRIEDIFKTGHAQRIKALGDELVAFQRGRRRMEDRWFGAAFAGR